MSSKICWICQQNPSVWSLDNSSPFCKISSKSFHNLLRYTTKCQFTPELLIAMNPQKTADRHQNMISSSLNLGHAQRLHKITPKFFRNFLNNPADSKKTAMQIRDNGRTVSHNGVTNSWRVTWVLVQQAGVNECWLLLNRECSYSYWCRYDSRCRRCSDCRYTGAADAAAIHGYCAATTATTTFTHTASPANQTPVTGVSMINRTSPHRSRSVSLCRVEPSRFRPAI